jgi:hypothetical protein
MNIMIEAFPWLGFIFWLGVFSWLGIKAWSRYLVEQERQKTLRIFAERGASLDKEMMEKLYPAMASMSPSESWKPTAEGAGRALAVMGIVCLFLGIGLLIGAQFVGRIEPEALIGMSTGGAIVCCLGLGLITASWALRRMRATDKESAATAGEDIR